MGVLDSLKEVYKNIEEGYYSVLDKIDGAGIPVYKVVDAIEANDIPSFPIAIISTLVVVGLLAMVLNGLFFAGAQLTVFVQETDGSSVSGANIRALVEGEEIASGITNSAGQSVLEVPLNKEVELKISKNGFNDKISYYTSLEGEETTTITIGREITTIRKTINFLEAGTSRLLKDSITIQFSCRGTSFNQTRTTSNGFVELDLPSDCDVLIANPEGDFTIDDGPIFLSSDESFNLSLSTASSAKGNVLVTVVNNNGETLPGIDVSLYIPTETNTPGTSFQSKQTNATGTATFDNVPLGRYYVVTYDRTGNFAEYDGLGQGVIQEVSENSFTQFSVVLSENVAGKVKLIVKDSQTSEAIANALVTLSKGETQITTDYTDDQGKVEFNVGEDVEYTVVVDKPGYLLKINMLRPSRDFTQIEIEQATAENSESLLVNIVDENDSPIENVRVKLKRNADRTQIGSEIVTGLDGRVIFERVEDGLYFVYAIKPGFGEVTSEPIRLDSRSENVLKLRMPIGLGRIEASVIDDQGNPAFDASIKVVDTFSDQVIEEVTTDADGKKIINVRADKKVFLIVSSSEFVNAITVPIQMHRDQTAKISIVLQRSVDKFDLELLGLFVNGEKVSETERALSTGQRYTALFNLMIPKNTNFEEAGVHIRTGSEQNDSVEKDNIYITEVRAAYDSLQKGTTYNPPIGQGNDFQHLTTGNAKWANVTMKNVTGGVYQIEVDVQIRDEARLGSALELWYRGFGRSGGFIRVPADTVLGSGTTSSQKEGLYANALKRTYSIGPSSLCGEEFCSNYTITGLREGITTSIVDEYTAQISSDYRLNFDLTSVSETPFSATQLVIKDKSSGLSIESYNITTATGEQRTGSGVGSELSIALGELAKDSVVKGEITLNTRKEGTIPLEISILSGSGNTIEVYKKIIYVKVEPADSLNIDILPKVIVPFINNNLLIRVTTEDDQTISNAFVTLVKDEDIIASGQTDIDGIFAYTLLSPGDGATISVVVEKTGFKPKEKQITVSSNILFTEPPTIKLNLTVGGTAFKTLDVDLLNATLIPLDVDLVEVSKVFQGFADIDFEEPSIGTTIGEDSNTSLFATIRLGSEGKVISEPLKLLGAINVHVSNSNFDQTWLATIPFELTIGFGNEVDDTQCFNVFPSEWNIFGSTSETQSFRVTVTNSCVVNGEKVSLRNISARVVAGNDNLLGSYRISSSLDGAISAQLENTFKVIGDSLGENGEESITIEFQPDNIISGASEVKIEIEATHFTANGEQQLTQRIDVSANINDLTECVEILTDREIVLQSCPFNTGYGNYGNQFNNYTNTQYGQFDPYTQLNGFGTGNPPFIGNNFNQSTLYSDPSLNYQGNYYPNASYNQPFYNGNNLGGGAFSQQFNNSFNCGQGGFAVRNNCASDVDLSFDTEPGIIVQERTITVAPGEEAEVIVEPTNFFGRYSLDVKAKPTESNEKSVNIQTVQVNVTNELAKNYRDCISVNPARTLNFNNFFGKPVPLEIRNTCYNEGVFLDESSRTIGFLGSGILTPTNAGSGRTELVESWAFRPPARFETGADGKVTQILRFEIVNSLKEYRNNAPEAKFFEENEFANIANLRYFASSGYYSVQERTNMVVTFTAPSAGRRTVTFPMILRDYWNILDFAERIQNELVTYGDRKVQACDCLNPNALDFTVYGNIEPGTILYTRENQNGKLFKVAEKGGCGNVDSLHSLDKTTIVTSNGITLEVTPDPADPKHELAIKVTSDGNSRRNIKETLRGKVTRISPPGTALCSLPIKMNVGASGDGTDPSGGDLRFACSEGEGQSGKDVFLEYGLQHINYSWEAEDEDSKFYVKPGSCDVYEFNERANDTRQLDLKDLKDAEDAPWFCDATQATIEFSRKIDEIKKAVEKGTENCTNPKGVSGDVAFSCKVKAKKNSENMFRYYLGQDKGYFLNPKGDGVVEIISDILYEDEPDLKVVKTHLDSLKELTAQEEPTKRNTFDDNKRIIQNSSTVINKLLELTSKEGGKFEGMSVVMEIKQWDKVNLTKPTKINATNFGTGWYALDLKDYQIFQDAIRKDDFNNGTCKGESCTIQIDGVDVFINTAFLQELNKKGKWKLSVRNVNGMSDLVKRLVMQKAKWDRGKDKNDDLYDDYESFWEFHTRNIEPNMYLIKDKYNDNFVRAFSRGDDYEEVKIETFNGDEPYEEEAGDYNVTIQYYWGDDRKGTTDIVFKQNRDLGEIDEDNEKNDFESNYENNVLFSIPIDGDIEWGTGFSGKNEKLTFNYDQKGEIGKREIQAKDDGDAEIKAKLVFSSDYEDFKEGKIISIQTDEIKFTPSDPVKIVAKVTKSSTENPAGFLYNLNTESKLSSREIAQDLQWKVTDVDDLSYPEGAIDFETHRYDDFCGRSGTNSYRGFKIDGDEKGSVEYTSVAFIPTDLDYAFRLECIKQSGNVEIESILDDFKEIGDVSRENRNINISDRIGDLAKAENGTIARVSRYNLQNLLTLVKDKEVCLTSNSNELELFWNDSEYWE